MEGELSEAGRARLDADAELLAYVDALVSQAEVQFIRMGGMLARQHSWLVALLDKLGGTATLDADLLALTERYTGYRIEAHGEVHLLYSLALVRVPVSPELAAAQAAIEARAEQPVELAERQRYLDALARASWRESGRIIRLVATNKDGGGVLASIDTNDQWEYRYALSDGRSGKGWPLANVQRVVRRLLREAAPNVSSEAKNV